MRSGRCVVLCLALFAGCLALSLEGRGVWNGRSVAAHAVYVSHGEDVRHTTVAARVLMRDRQVLTLPAPDVLRDARAMAERVRAAVASAPERR